MTTAIPLRLGTRRSPMAMAQSGEVARLITARTGREIELIGITSHGDVSQAQLTQIGGTGVFVSNLREALLRGEVDFAVHSLKDLPTGAAPGITLAAIPDRDDPRDALVSRDGLKFADLPRGARVGTGSPRRAQQLGLLRSDVTCVPVRGNANTRLAKVSGGEFDAIVLAYAGLARIGHTDLVSEIFEPDSMLPAPGQGALAIECRTDDPEMIKLLSCLDDAATRAAVTAERTLLLTLEAGCSAPVGAYACGSMRIKLQATVVGVDETAGSETMVVREHAEGSAADAAGLGRDLAARMLARGAARLMGAADGKSDGAPRGRTTDRDDAHD